MLAEFCLVATGSINLATKRRLRALRRPLSTDVDKLEVALVNGAERARNCRERHSGPNLL